MKISDQKKKLNKLERSFKEYAADVVAYIQLLDEIIKETASLERGKRLGMIVTGLELVTDKALHFSLDMGWLRIRNFKKRILNESR